MRSIIKKTGCSLSILAGTLFIQLPVDVLAANNIATQAAAPTKTVVVTGKIGLNVRKGPGTKYAIVKALPLNTKVMVYGEKDGWYKIGTNQWIHMNHTKSKSTKSMTSAKTVMVTGKIGLNVRKGPGIKYAIVRALPLNKKVKVYEEKNGWYKIGTNQWINGHHTK